MGLRPAFVACFVLALASLSPAQTTWYVDDDGTPPGSGTPGDPYTSIQFAISRPGTLDGDTIHVYGGTYFENVDFLGKAIVVRGEPGQLPTIDGGAIGRVVTFRSGEGSASRLEGFVLANGSAGGPFGGTRGAGVLCLGTSPTIVACLIRDNSDADLGAGIYGQDSDADFERCVFESNTATSSGGHAYIEGGEPRFTSCTFRGMGTFSMNGAFSGGAMYLQGAETTLTGCTFDANVSIGSGGAIYQEGGTLGVEESHFLDNFSECYWGGAIHAEDGATTLIGCLFEGNSAFDDRLGGAVHVTRGELAAAHSRFADNHADGGGAAWIGVASRARILHCTFEANHVSAYFYEPGGSGGALGVDPSASVVVSHSVFASNQALGGGIRGEPGTGGAVYGPARLSHCTLWNNSAAVSGGAGHHAELESSVLWSDAPDELSGSATARWCDVEGGAVGPGNFDSDPRFWDAADGDFRLKPHSPCIDAGHPGDALDADGSRADVGAFAFDPDLCPDCPSIGASYCAANANSTGYPASISAWGDDHADANLVVLRVEHLPPGKAALFLMSDTPGFQTGFGQGNLCLGGTIMRLAPAPGALFDTGAGTLSFSPDVLALPSLASVQAGETWRFQLWYRDENPRSTSNGSDGVAVTFR